MCKVVFDAADVKQRIHVVESAPELSLLKFHGVGGLVLGQSPLVHRVEPAQLPPQPWVVPAAASTKAR